MPFNVKNPDLCTKECECKPTAPAAPCKCDNNNSDDCCLSLCSISTVSPLTEKKCPNYSANILDPSIGHNLNACGGETITATIADSNADDFTSLVLEGYDLKWTVNKSTKNEYSEVTIKVECGCYAAYMCVLIKLEKGDFNLTIKGDPSSESKFNVSVSKTESNPNAKPNLTIK